LDVAQRPFQLLEGIVAGFVAEARNDQRIAVRVKEELGDDVHAVCAALPDLSVVFGARDRSHQAPEAFGEVRTIQALAHFLELIGDARKPAIVIVDDCQWADQLAYRVLQRWAAATDSGVREATHTSLIVSFRQEEVSATHVLRRLPCATHIRLAAFNAVEIQQLVESMAGTLPAEVCRLVIQISDGSPFIATAVLRGLVETGALRPTASRWIFDQNLFGNIQSSEYAGALLSRRIALLPAAAQRMLTIAAVLGKEFPRDMVTSLAGLPPSEAAQVLYDARQRHLVWAKPDGVHYAFIHDKIRSALLDRMTAAQRNEYHRLAAEHLLQIGSDRLQDVAYHFDASGEYKRSLPFALQAAEQARAQYALEVAERQYRIAERGAMDADRQTLFRISSGLGNVLMLQGRYADAAPYFAKAEQVAEDPLTQAEIRARSAELAFKRGDMDFATKEFECSAAGYRGARGCSCPC
jgi:predicted ATPase